MIPRGRGLGGHEAFLVGRRSDKRRPDLKHLHVEKGMIILRKNNNKAFTLAELLIVVAIIAVLVAIAIPVFTTQLEKSREATDIANVRSAYATVIADYLVEGGSTAKTIEVDAKQTVSGWQTSNGGQIEYMNGSSAGVYSYEPQLAGDKYAVTISFAASGADVTPKVTKASSTTTGGGTPSGD